MQHGIKTEKMDSIKDIMVCKYLRDTMERKLEAKEVYSKDFESFVT